jgi:preprotein translocase subunit Sss1
MEASLGEALAWERRWSLPAALAAFGAIGFVIAAIVVASKGVGAGNGDSELLRNVDAHQAAQIASSILQAIGVALLALPLYYLFRAARARSDSMRGQLVGVVIAAPLFLAILAIVSGVSTLHAASDFVSKEVPRLEAKKVALDSDKADEAATDEITEAPLRPLAAGFGLAGQIGFVIAMVYTCLHAMRTGLLTRFWGSLGMALGAVSFIFFQFALLWFAYLGLLIAGRLPGGRPPAWDSGEAMPWPSPGEKAARSMEPPADSDGSGSEPPVLPGDESGGGPRKKRKQRD